MRKLCKTIGILLLVIAVLAGGLIGYLSATEYNPEPVTTAEFRYSPSETALSPGQTISVLTWNIGYCGLSKDADFFMDGGSMVYPTSQDVVLDNLSYIDSYLDSADAQIILVQEVDRDSRRSGRIDQLDTLAEGWGYSFAPNYRCNFVPYPLPPIGKVDSGVMTLFSPAMTGEATRISLPCPFSWPIRVANLKRCLLVNRFPLDDGKELVVVNFHLEAYDDGEGKLAQTKLLMEILQQEYEKGNYVLAGGDFNQTFPGVLERYPLQSQELWTPGTLEESMLPEGWHFAYDMEVPTCRSLDRSLDPEDPTMQYYCIDGFLVSPNITVQSVQTQDLGFAHSDHNPVALTITLNERSQPA